MRTALLLAIATTLPMLAACQSRATDAPATASASAATPAAAPAATDLVSRGEYLIRTAGCNDCHTAGYPESQGRMETSQWLMGSRIGFKGPWGTTYATNLAAADRRHGRGAMADGSRPTCAPGRSCRTSMFRAMNEDDRRAIFHFIKSLGPAGEPAPAYLPPGEKPPLPYYELMLPTAVPPKA
jgi:cytochrome c5